MAVSYTHLPAKRIEDGTLRIRIVRSIRVGVVRQFVHIAPQHLGSIPAQQFGTRAVDEYAMAVQVNTEDAFPGGVEQQLELILPKSGATGAVSKSVVCQLGEHGASLAMLVPR